MTRTDLFIQPPIMRMHVARKTKRERKLWLDHILDWQKRKKRRFKVIPCPWPCPSLTPVGAMPQRAKEVLC